MRFEFGWRGSLFWFLLPTVVYSKMYYWHIVRIYFLKFEMQIEIGK